MKHPKKLLKVLILIAGFTFAAAYGLSGRRVSAYVAGPPEGHTGAPSFPGIAAEPTCTDCHFSFALNSGPGSLSITGLPANYSLNQEVTVTVTLTHNNRPRYGFQLTALDDTGKPAGTLTSTDGNTQVIPGQFNRRYIEHTLAGTTPATTNTGRWSFKWKAPASSVGKVTFYAAGNAANGNNLDTGDFIYATSTSVQPPAAANPVVTVSSASFLGPEVASEAIVAAFGVNMATSSAAATTIPLPTSLAGTTVKVKDSANTERLAPLFFVSAGQVNYQIPQGTVNGAATVTVTSGDGTVSTGTVQITTVTPGFYTFTGDGQGVPAGVLLRVRDGQQTTENIFQLDAQNKIVPAPIDLGPSTDTVFLILFGTGIRNRSSLAAVIANIGGTNYPVDFAGPQGGFVGLDQLNIRLPRELAGRGQVDLVLTVDNKAANKVTVNIK